MFGHSKARVRRHLLKFHYLKRIIFLRELFMRQKSGRFLLQPIYPAYYSNRFFNTLKKQSSNKH